MVQPRISYVLGSVRLGQSLYSFEVKLSSQIALINDLLHFGHSLTRDKLKVAFKRPLDTKLIPVVGRAILVLIVHVCRMVFISRLVVVLMRWLLSHVDVVSMVNHYSFSRSRPIFVSQTASEVIACCSIQNLPSSGVVHGGSVDCLIVYFNGLLLVLLMNLVVHWHVLVNNLRMVVFVVHRWALIHWLFVDHLLSRVFVTHWRLSLESRPLILHGFGSRMMVSGRWLH